MEYLKHLLHKEKTKLEEYETLVELFEMVGNHQEIKNIGKKALTLVGSLTGDVALVAFVESKYNLIAHFGNKDRVEQRLEERNILKLTKETKKPYIRTVAEKKDPNYFMVLPIFAKDEYVGALCIFEEQVITCWKEIHVVLQLMSNVLKLFKLTEINKNVNMKDMVTDLFNYRHFQDQLDLELEKTIRYYTPLSIVMVDVADFRKVNEKLGYEAGDDVLRTVASWIRSSCRRIDMPVRMDADTFVILLSNTDLGGAKAVLDRILFKAKTKQVNAGGKEFKVKIKTAYVQYETHWSREEFVQSVKTLVKPVKKA